MAMASVSLSEPFLPRPESIPDLERPSEGARVHLYDQERRQQDETIQNLSRSFNTMAAEMEILREQLNSTRTELAAAEEQNARNANERLRLERELRDLRQTLPPAAALNPPPPASGFRSYFTRRNVTIILRTGIFLIGTGLSLYLASPASAVFFGTSACVEILQLL
jgi:hypothetical protein